MTTQQALTLASLLMTQWGLVELGWGIDFNRRKRSLGLCNFKSRNIELSLYFIQANDEEKVRNTILHEIAHALAGPGAGHGPVWRAWARKVGARPERCGQAEMPAGAWKAACGQCQKVHSMHRKPRRSYRCACQRLAPTLVWTKENLVAS